MPIEEFNFKALSFLKDLFNPHNDHTKRLIDQKTFSKHILQVKIKRETCEIVRLRKLWKSSLLPNHCHGKVLICVENVKKKKEKREKNQNGSPPK